MKNYLYGIAVLFLVGMIGFCVKETVRGQEQLELAEKEQFYREQEKVLLRETEEQLTQMGYAHCGITLNRVVEKNTERTYTFTIHHRKIDRMDPAEREALMQELKALAEKFPCASPEDSCEFEYQFFTL